MIKLVVDQIKRLYQDLNLTSFKEPDSDVAKRIVSLYSKINYDNTTENIKNIMKFSTYYPDLIMIKPQEDYKIINAQNYFYQISLALLLKKNYKQNFVYNNEEKMGKEELLKNNNEFQIGNILKNIFGKELPDEKFIGHIFFSPENHCLFQIDYFMENNKNSSNRHMHVKKLNTDLVFDDYETIEFNDLDFYVDLGKLN